MTGSFPRQGIPQVQKYQRINRRNTAQESKNRCTDKARPRNPVMQVVINQEVDKMLEKEVIEPSRSAWSSPIVIGKKKNREQISHRFSASKWNNGGRCISSSAYSGYLPDKLRGALSTIDLKSGYWQVLLTPASRVTAFTVPRELMHFKIIPFGLHSGPATFQRLLDTVLG